MAYSWRRIREVVPGRVKSFLMRIQRKLFRPARNPDQWSDLIMKRRREWEVARRNAAEGPRVLIGLSLGGFPIGALVESTLAAALVLRGAQVDILLCDSFLPACQMTEIGNTTPQDLAEAPPQPRCGKCHTMGQQTFTPLGLPIYWYGHLVNASEAATAQHVAATLPFDQIEGYQFDGLAVGEHAAAGALRYFAQGDLGAEPEAEVVVRRYLEAALLTVFAIQNLLRRNHYEVACFNHGIYVPQGLLGEVCRKEGVRVVTWNPAYRKQCFVFSHDDSYHHTMITEPLSEWENLTLTPELEKMTLDYLDSRRDGTQDWIWFHDSPEEELSVIAKETGIDFSRPCIGLLTSVMWDARLHYKSNAFPDMLTWVFQTIGYFARRPDLQLVIRVHPAEVHGAIPSRQRMVDEIKKEFPTLPPNVFVIGPESQVSTYAIIDHSNAVLVYNTKTGIEISSLGIPVIVAGEAWIRNKGFSLDATSPAEYFQMLDTLPLNTRLGQNMVERARKYAFHFFFRRMIPLPFISGGKDYRFTFEISDLNQLRPGSFAGLDIICKGILDKRMPFNYPADRLVTTAATESG